MKTLFFPRHQLNGRTSTFLRNAALYLFLLTVCTSCFKNVSDTIKNSTDKAINVLNDAIASLNNQSSNWQQVLQDAQSKLTEDAQSTIRTEVDNLLNRGIAATSNEIRCNADFIGNRIKDHLVALVAQLQGKPAPPLQPYVCSILPAGGIDASLVPDRVNLLEFYGYDFDITAVKIFLVNGTTEVDVTEFLDQPSHYHITLNLSNNGVKLSPQSKRFILKWNNQIQSTVAITQPSTPVCKTQVKSFFPPNISYMPPHTRGDKDYSGHGPKVNITTKLINHVSRVDVQITMKAEETKSDFTTASGTFTTTIFTPDPGFKVKSIINTATNTFSYTDTNHDDDIFNVGGDGPVLRYKFRGDRGGDDAGVYTNVDIKFNELRFLLEETGNCTPSAMR